MKYLGGVDKVRNGHDWDPTCDMCPRPLILSDVEEFLVRSPGVWVFIY